MGIPAFQLGRDRDAWATIRGYVYQVALSIDRWIDLNDNEHLELERGEDIDTVTKILAASGAEESSRLLEQIKHRETNVTLRSSSVIEFLAAAVEHLKNNPGQALRFRFLTTARAGVELPSPFTPRHPALSHWVTIVSKGQLDVNVVNKILDLVRQAKQPEKLARTTWDEFQAFLSGASAQTFFGFMKATEWALDAGNLNALVPAIRAKLIQRGHCTTEEEAQDLYQRLFFHVFQLLSQEGMKALRKPDLATQLARPPLAPQYQALFAHITGHLAELESKVEAVELNLSAVQGGLLGVEESLAVYRAEVQRIAGAQGLPTSITLGRRTFVYVAPPLGQGIAHRTVLVESLRGDLATASLLVLSGQSSIGKTQLARLLIEPEKTLWLGLRQKKPDECAALFEATLPVATAEHKPIIVLDDLPRLSAGELMADLLLHFANNEVSAMVKVVATISWGLPLAIREDFPQGFLIERRVPLLEEDEIREMLHAQNAPERFLEANAVQLVREATAGHPLLVRASIRYLQKQNWSLTADVVQGLIQKEFARDVQKEVQVLLQRTVERDESRQLLYRLDLVGEPIRQRHLHVVSAVAPAITSPFEHLVGLHDLWIQDTAVEQYSLSPLLEGIGVKNLSKELQKNIHRSLGADIVGRRPMSLFGVSCRESGSRRVDGGVHGGRRWAEPYRA